MYEKSCFDDAKNFSVLPRNSSNKLGFKISVTTIILTLVLFTGGMQFMYADFAKSQFFENEGTKRNITNSSHFLSNSTLVKNPKSDELVLLRQKLNNASFNYRVLEGQIQNIGNGTAKSIVVRLTVFDKDKGVIGSEFTYPHLHSLKPNLKSTFKMTASNDDFKGMKYYQLSLEWVKPDGSKGYVENAQIYNNTVIKKGKGLLH